MKILFVCTGNTCRSSMAGAVANKLLEDRHNLQNIVFESAGVAAIEGEPASREAIAAMAELGIDLERHRAVLLTPEAVRQAGLVLTMTAAHRQYIHKLVPSQADKVFTLAEYARSDGDVPDPFGQPLEAYRDCARKLVDLIGKVLDRLEEANNS
jgi:protein-tyrosine-phosphatase